MNKDLKLIQAELVVLLMRLDDLEYRLKLKNYRWPTPQTCVEELKAEALKIIDQIG